MYNVPFILRKTYCSQEDDHSKVVDDKETHGGKLRYLGYLRSAALVVSRGTRYLAYTSDVGEAFRPILPARAVNMAYGISWLYIFGDVGLHGYMEYKNKSSSKKIGVTVLHSAVFQSVASMLIPTLTIHTVVHQSHKLFHGDKIPKLLKTYGPSALGLSCIPLLPLVDEPVEQLVDYVFIKMFPEEMKKSHHE